MRTLKTDDGVPLHWRQWNKTGMGPARGTVLIVHGLGEHVGRYEHVAAHLNHWGWHVVGHDQRGHGASGGARGDLPHDRRFEQDLALVIDELRADPGLSAGPLVMLGHSMGGLIAARFAAGGLPGAGSPPPWYRPLDGLVLSSPALAVDMSAFQRGLLAATLPLVPHLAVGNGLKPAWISRSQDVVSAYQLDPLVHNRITPTLAAMIARGGEAVLARAADWTLPTLLMWAGADRCVSPAGSSRFAAAAPKAVVQSQCFDKLFHEIFNEPEQQQVFERLRQWMDKR
ncbi:alpha/beta hydrolase [Roseateles sp. DB2]|uniref:alpha/beta hydrolase n=1 Tax=Roseateles sp. DB2 TaxID=3453717 RepID=UPI003EEC4CBD